jgi:hypothetical protein
LQGSHPWPGSRSGETVNSMPTASRHTSPARRLTLALLAAAAVAVSACATNATFINDYNEATKPLERSTTVLSHTTDQASRLRALDEQSSELHAVATRLRKLEAPEEAQDELKRLVASIDSFAGSEQVNVVALRSGDPGRVARAMKSLKQQGAEMVAANAALKAAVEG